MLTDEQIAALLAEPKRVVTDPLSSLRRKGAHLEATAKVAADSNADFRVVVRVSTVNPHNFSVILMHRPRGGVWLRLRRYNGRSHFHTNRLEGNRFYAYHIHTATERYAATGGADLESYAEATDRYADYRGAYRCLLRDCGFGGPGPDDGQLSLFPEEDE